MTATLLVAALASALTRTPAAGADTTARGCVADAESGVPIAGVEAVALRGGARTTSDALGVVTLVVAPDDSVRLRRIGYRPRVVAAARLAAGQSCVALETWAQRLPTLTVRDSVAAARTARLVATRTGDELRAQGAASVADAAALMPFVSARSSRGGVALSMRGSRSEQVTVTLDGVPLNDPSTGRADLSGLPLAFVGALSASPGSDAIGLGSGATGGVLALSGGTGSVVSAAAGSYGARRIEGAATGAVGAARVRVGAALSRARNDFPFVNDRGCTGCDSVERRVNADERSSSAVLSASLPSAQLLLMASDAAQGMAGPKNVRVFDDDRGREQRGVARLAASGGGWVATGSVRAFRLTYHDPSRPTFDTDARAVAADVDAARAVGAATLRAGAGFDRASGTSAGSGFVAPFRPRAFASVAGRWATARAAASAAARVDAVRTAGTRATASLAVEGRGAVAPFARVSQAFRVPTLYDQYFASPQRVIVRPLRPEYVIVDAESGVRAAAGAVSTSAAAFARVTDDAIVWFPGNFAWSPTNAGRERVYGGEGQATLALRWLAVDAWAGAYVPRLSAGSAVVPTPYVPHAAGGATATIHGGPARLVATLRATGRRPYLNAPATRDHELPGVAIVGLHAGATLPVRGATATLDAGVDDVGDVRWEPVRGYPTAGRTWTAGITIQP
ncbi:MAG TPA: TonB-dependent receptor [Gemmatimonadaceae bacterium]|nr:TonB-dependent receptor [Gemmatimonadaceae bacterium]